MLASDGFLCRYCYGFILDGMSVYMCGDAAYCSLSCRRRGRCLRVPDDRKAYSDASTSELHSTSDNGSATGSSASSAGIRKPDDKSGFVGWLVSKAVHKLAAMVQGTELVRNLSGADYREYLSRCNEGSPQAIRDDDHENYGQGAHGQDAAFRGLQQSPSVCGSFLRPSSDFVQLVEGPLTAGVPYHERAS